MSPSTYTTGKGFPIGLATSASQTLSLDTVVTFLTPSSEPSSLSIWRYNRALHFGMLSSLSGDFAYLFQEKIYFQVSGRASFSFNY